MENVVQQTLEMLQRALGLQQRGELVEAEKLYRDVLKIDPNHFDALHLLGLLKHQQRKNSDARELIGSALKINPNYPDALLNYGSILAALDLYEEALTYFDRTLVLDPNSFRALNNRANALVALGRFDEALACFDSVLALNPNHANAHINRALALMDLGRYAEALTSYERALTLRPEHADSQQLLAAAELTLGNFASGWKRCEWRWKATVCPPKPRPFPQLRWNGEYVDGTLLVWGEQGLGDQILHASMVPDLGRRAKSVVLEVEPRLVKLLARSFPDTQVLARGNAIPENVKAQSPIGSLGQYLRPSWESFPRRPTGYLKADQDLTASLRGRLSPKGETVVGLSWLSKSPYGYFKTAQLTDFGSVLRLPGCRYIDLQYGDTLAEREALTQTTGLVVERLEDVDNLNDIDALAALITACDVVVTVSNITAHLAGALGKPTWLFVPHSGGRLWYWFVDRGDSPWYPRVHIWRQKQAQPWKDLIASAGHEIAPFVQEQQVRPQA